MVRPMFRRAGSATPLPRRLESHSWLILAHWVSEVYWCPLLDIPEGIEREGFVPDGAAIVARQAGQVVICVVARLLVIGIDGIGNRQLRESAVGVPGEVPHYGLAPNVVLGGNGVRNHFSPYLSHNRILSL